MTIGGCGGSSGGGVDGDGDGGGDVDITQAEAQQIFDAIIDALNEIFTALTEEQRELLETAQVIQIPISPFQVACPLGGRITVSANAKFDDDTGQLSGQGTIQFSDPTNDLFNCTFPGLFPTGYILTGTLFPGFTGSFVDPNLNIVINIDGSVGLNEQGQIGLIPRGSCRIFLRIEVRK